MSIFFLIIVAADITGCEQLSPSTNGRLADKIRAFRLYVTALDDCKKLPMDSLLSCAGQRINLDTIPGISTAIWREYGLAKAHFHNNLGVEAIQIINEALPATESEEWLYERAELLELRSTLYMYSYKMQLAAEDMYHAADIYLQLGLEEKAASRYVEIAGIQYNAGDYTLTTEISRQALSIYKNMTSLSRGDSAFLMNLYNTIALSYLRVNKLDSAEKYYQYSYDMAEALNDEFWKGLVIGNRADILLREGQTEQAIRNYQYDIKVSLQYKEYASAALSYLSLGNIHMDNDDLLKAKLYYDSAEAYILRSGRPMSMSKYHELISKWHERMQHPELALQHYKKSVKLRDSIQSIEINSQLQHIRNQKEIEKQLADINLLQAENDLHEKELLISRITILTIVFVSLLLLGILYLIRRSNRRLKNLNDGLENKVRARTAKLRKINRELDTYLYRASHDVRRPILTILGLLRVSENTDDRERGVIRQSIKATALEMDKMLKKLQMAYELEKQRKSEKVIVDLNNYCTDKVDALQREYPDIVFEVMATHEMHVRINRSLLDTIMMNILENACVFSSETDGMVKVTIERNHRYVLVSVEDNGIGIESVFLDQIFKPYTRFSNKSTGSGLGLYLASKAARKIGGSIHVQSECMKGSKFTVSLLVHPLEGDPKSVNNGFVNGKS